MGYESTYTCPKCGKKWDIYKHKISMRDKDSLDCDCGEEIIRWNGGVMYNARPSSKEK